MRAEFYALIVLVLLTGCGPRAVRPEKSTEEEGKETLTQGTKFVVAKTQDIINEEDQNTHPNNKPIKIRRKKHM